MDHEIRATCICGKCKLNKPSKEDLDNLISFLRKNGIEELPAFICKPQADLNC